MLRTFTRSLSTTPIAKASYGGRHTAVLIPGDGIGQEMSGHLTSVFKQIQAPVDFETIDVRGEDYHSGEIDRAIQAISRSGAAIKGNITTSIKDHVVARNQRIRHDLDLYANVIHAKSLPGIKTRHDNVDVLLIRENTEGEYAAKEHEIIYKDQRIIQSLKVMTEPAVERLARFAFEYAIKHDRRKVTAVHKANIMKKGDGLFRAVCKEVSKEYPEIRFEDMIVDNTCMQLVNDPWQFDVMLCPNLYGNIVGNVLCGLVGGPGITAGSNFNNEIAVFEMATRNTGDSIVGRDIANPSAFLMAGAKLLYHFKEYKHGDLIKNAVRKTIADQIHTPDLGGTHTTTDVMSHITKNIREELKRIAAED